MKKILLSVSLLLLILVGCSQDKGIMNGYNVPDNHKFIRPEGETDEAVFDEMIRMTEAREPGVYFFGFSNCPWCQHLAPVLNQALEDNDMNAYYIDVKNPAFNGVIDRFETMVSSLPLAAQNNGSVPYVLVIKEDGSVKGQILALDSDNGKDPLTDEQTEELYNATVTLIK